MQTKLGGGAFWGPGRWARQEATGPQERPTEGPWASDKPLSGILGAQVAGKAPNSWCDLTRPAALDSSFTGGKGTCLRSELLKVGP
jgi:hypothetical protein